MILLVGNKLKLGGLAEAIKRLDEAIEYIDENFDIKKQENTILLTKENPKYIIYDIGQYYNDPDEIIDIIYRIYKTNKAKPIFLIPTDNPNNEVLKKAVEKNFKYYINTSLQLGKQKDKLEKIVSGYYDSNDDKIIEQAEEKVNGETKALNDFVEDLYLSKQREEKKEKTIIINKKRTGEIVIDVMVKILKTIFAIISVMLMGLAIITLCYEAPRNALFNVLMDGFNTVF